MIPVKNIHLCYLLNIKLQLLNVQLMNGINSLGSPIPIATVSFPNFSIAKLPMRMLSFPIFITPVSIFNSNIPKYHQWMHTIPFQTDRHRLLSNVQPRYFPVPSQHFSYEIVTFLIHTSIAHCTQSDSDFEMSTPTIVWYWDE